MPLPARLWESWLTPTVEDDAGARVEVFDLKADKRRPPEQRLPQGVRDRVAAAMTADPGSMRVGAFIGLSFFAVSMALGSFLSGSARNLMSLGISVALTVTAGPFVWAVLRKRSGRTMAATLCSLGRCGSCGYDLAGLAQDGAGLVRCPECPAAGRADRAVVGGRDAAEASLEPVSWWVRARSGRGIIDARERAFQPIALRALRRRADGETDAAARRRLAAREIRAIGRGWRVASLALLLPAVGALAISILTIAGPPAMRGTVPAGVWLFIIVHTTLTAVMLTSGQILANPVRRRAACLRFSVCPSCARDLHGLPLDSEGCAVCPECGGAWRPLVD